MQLKQSADASRYLITPVQPQQLPDLKGHRGKLAPHSLMRQPEGSSHLSIIFPRMGYTAQMPLLYYASHVPLTEGAHVMAVEPGYTRQKGFPERSAEEQRAWVRVDTLAVWKAVSSQRQYERITLIGNSR